MFKKLLPAVGACVLPPLAAAPSFASEAQGGSAPAVEARSIADSPIPKADLKPLKATGVTATANAESSVNFYERMAVVAYNFGLYNYLTQSTSVGSQGEAPSGAKLAGVAWDHSVTRYNSEYPGSVYVELCSASPQRCFNISAYPSAWTDQFNDLDAATTKFYFKTGWMNSSKRNGPYYDALVGTGIRPFMRADLGAFWN